MKNILVLLITTTLLSGCVWPWGRNNIQVSAEPKAPLSLPEVDVFVKEPIGWYIITPETQKEVFKDLQDRGYDPVLFGLTDEGYENLAINQAKMLKLMRQLKAQVSALKEYYMESNTDDFNPNKK